LHLKSQQESWFKEATKHIADLEVIQPGKSYRNKDLGIDICYKDPGWGTSPLRQMLPYIALEMDTSSSTVRKVPCLSCGWSTANPNEYKNNRSNILGSISPFVSVGGIKYLEEKHKKDVVDLVCHVIEFFSPSGIHPTPFFHSDPIYNSMIIVLRRSKTMPKALSSPTVKENRVALCRTSVNIQTVSGRYCITFISVLVQSIFVKLWTMRRYCSPLFVAIL
jgi:hypothetical protein